MNPEHQAEYLSMIPRVFVRALRDPVGVDIEFELSEGQASSLLRAREDAAYARGLEDAARVATDWTTAEHIASDMAAGIFPQQSPVQDAIAAAIRALKPPQKESAP